MRLALLCALTGVLLLAPAAQAERFAPAVHFPAGTTPQSLTTADFNRDGDPDLVVGKQGTESGVLMGGHGLGLGPLIPVAPGGSSVGAAVADFKGDGDTDIAFARPSGRVAPSASRRPTPWARTRRPLRPPTSTATATSTSLPRAQR
jgi:VCBS repeat protein